MTTTFLLLLFCFFGFNCLVDGSNGNVLNSENFEGIEGNGTSLPPEGQGSNVKRTFQYQYQP